MCNANPDIVASSLSVALLLLLMESAVKANLEKVYKPGWDIASDP